MLSEYLDAAMRLARYETMEDGRYWGEIPLMQGVWAAAETLDACQRELREVAEEWTLMGYWLHHSLPIIDDIDPNLKMEIEPESDEATGPYPEAATTGIPGTVSGRQTPVHGSGHSESPVA